MFRVDAPGSVPSLPAPAGVGTPGFFASIGSVPPTRVQYDYLNMIQEEIVAVVQASGLVLDQTKLNYAQLLQSARRIAGGNTSNINTSLNLTPDQSGFVFVSAASNNVTLTLPPSASANGAPMTFDIYRYDGSANTVTVQRSGNDQIFAPTSSASLTLGPSSGVSIRGDGFGSWAVVGSFPPPAAPNLLASNNLWTGENTYGVSPVVPTTATGDASGNAASTQFVANAISPLATTAALNSDVSALYTSITDNVNAINTTIGNDVTTLNNTIAALITGSDTSPGYIELKDYIINFGFDTFPNSSGSTSQKTVIWNKFFSTAVYAAFGTARGSSNSQYGYYPTVSVISGSETKYQAVYNADNMTGGTHSIDNNVSFFYAAIGR